MLEYPLWYAYFPGIAAVSLGVSETVVVSAGSQSRQVGAGADVAPRCMAAANIYQDYRTLRS